MFATDAQGRVYRLGEDRKATLLVETNEGEATRLLATPNGLMAATGEMGKLFRLADSEGASGSYESPVHDAGIGGALGPDHVARREAVRVSFSTRIRKFRAARQDLERLVGAADRSEQFAHPQSQRALHPVARELDGPGAAVENVSVAYLPQNNPPVVRSINVTTQAAHKRVRAKAGGTNSSSNSAFSITVTDTGEVSSAGGHSHAGACARERFANPGHLAGRRSGRRPAGLFGLFSRRRRNASGSCCAPT